MARAANTTVMIRTAHAHLGDDHRHHRLDRRVIGHRRLADGHP
jgi:hypothetical protein